MNKDKLIKLLKKTNKMSNKYLAKRILEVDSKDVVEQNRIKDKCYNLLLTLMDDESKRMIVTLDAIYNLLVDRICLDSNWKYEHNYFYLQDLDSSEIYFVIRGEDGFKAGSDNKNELSFIIEYQSILNMLINNLQEKKVFLNGNFKTKNPSDYELANSLINYLELDVNNKDNNYSK